MNCKIYPKKRKQKINPTYADKVSIPKMFIFQQILNMIYSFYCKAKDMTKLVMQFISSSRYVSKLGIFFNTRYRSENKLRN